MYINIQLLVQGAAPFVRILEVIPPKNVKTARIGMGENGQKLAKYRYLHIRYFFIMKCSQHRIGMVK